MELFTKEMRKRIMKYGSNPVVGDDERNKEGDNRGEGILMGRRRMRGRKKLVLKL